MFQFYLPDYTQQSFNGYHQDSVTRSSQSHLGYGEDVWNQYWVDLSKIFYFIFQFDNTSLST